MMTLQQLATAISLRSKGRYELQPKDKIELPETDHSSLILRLKRAHIEQAGWRTILLIELPSRSVQAAHQWAASIRDALPEPETSDLFMFLILQEATPDEAIRIETDDRFCRKIVARPQETPMELLDRTFLAALEPPGNIETLSDPLVAALDALSSAHSWTKEHINLWKTELLSSMGGADIARSLRTSMTASKDQQ